MNSMERVVTALQYKEPDRVPVYPILSGVSRKLVDATYKEWSTHADICSKALLKAREEFDLDCIVTLIDLSIECDAWGQELIYPENEAAHPNYDKCVIQDLEAYQKIKKVDYKTSERMMMHIDVCKKVVEASNGEFPVIALIGCVTPAKAVIGTDEEWEQECRNNIEDMKAGGGFMLATGCEYPANASFDRAVKMVELAKTYGRY